MKVLVVGGGGREHALVWKIAQSPSVDDIVAAPGNAGIARLARTVPLRPDDVEGIVRFAEEEECDLTVVGPELPLALGLADLLADRGLAVFGPTRSGARIEASKWFAKELMFERGIPTARARLAQSRDEAVSAAREVGYPVVIKADGLAGGKGVVVATTEEEAVAAIDGAMLRRRFGPSGERVLIEEFLEGEEASILAFTDGKAFGLMAPSQDHKRAFDGDLGPNTGGMGAYAPAPVVTPEVLEEVEDRIIGPTIAALKDIAGVEYRGVLYAGLMITCDGPKVVEFNCRFGDPEAQVTLPLLDADVVEIMLAVVRGELDPSSVCSKTASAACIVMASRGYPGSYETGKEIAGLNAASELEGVLLFHAGTTDADGRTVTSGGRVLGVTGVAPDLSRALAKAYDAVGLIHFDGAHYRTDIGRLALARLEAGGRATE